jgi:hypothetical protein
MSALSQRPRVQTKWSVSYIMSRLCCLLSVGALGICEGPLTGLDLGAPCGQCGTVTCPLNRHGGLVGKLFVQGQPQADGFPVGKVIGGQHLVWDDGAGDVDVMEPTGVDRRMAQNTTRSDLRQPLLRRCPAMRRAVVPQPEPPFAGPLRFLRQPLLDQLAPGRGPGPRCTPAHHGAPAHVPGGQILQGTASGCQANRLPRPT